MEEEEEESMMQCPYNAAHTILKHRMAAHLIKCRQQYPSDNFSTCPFNATHDVPTRELQVCRPSPLKNLFEMYYKVAVTLKA